MVSIHEIQENHQSMHHHKAVAARIEFCALIDESEHTCSNRVSLVLLSYGVSTHKIISSTALPKVMFIKAPIVSPSSLATLSVA